MDTVVLEIGIGGRRDARNVVPDEAISVSALTAVDLDQCIRQGRCIRVPGMVADPAQLSMG